MSREIELGLLQRMMAPVISNRHILGVEYYDLPIMGLEGDFILVPNPAAGTYGASQGTLIEIYTPRTFEEDSELYYQVGPINRVIDGYHMNIYGTSQSARCLCSWYFRIWRCLSYWQSFLENITTSTLPGDLFPVESMHWSDFYISDAYDRGKPNRVLTYR